jgi:hypothetical protein
VRPSQDGSISIEQFALGVLAVYALNIGVLTILICFVPFGMFFGGVVLTEPGVAPKSALTAIAVLVCLFVLSGVGGLFYWGVRSIFRRKFGQAIIFLALLLAEHVALVRFGLLHIGLWLPAAIACLSVVVLLVVALKRRGIVRG